MAALSGLQHTTDAAVGLITQSFLKIPVKTSYLSFNFKKVLEKLASIGLTSKQASIYAAAGFASEVACLLPRKHRAAFGEHKLQ